MRDTHSIHYKNIYITLSIKNRTLLVKLFYKNECTSSFKEIPVIAG